LSNESYPSNASQIFDSAKETARSLKELIQEVGPATVPSREEISKIHEELADLRGQLRVKPVEKSEVSKLRELLEFVVELQAHALPKHKEPELSDRDRMFLTLLKESGAEHESLRAIRDFIVRPERTSQPEQLGDKLMELARQNPELVERVSTTLERIVARILPTPRPGSTPSKAHVPGSRTENGTQSTPATAAQNEEPQMGITLDSFVLGIKEDIQEGNDPEDAIADAVMLFTEQPELAPVIVATLEKPNKELLAALYQATGARLDSLSNANEYLDGLRDGVRKRLRIPQADASKNATN